MTAIIYFSCVIMAGHFLYRLEMKSANVTRIEEDGANEIVAEITGI